MSLAQYPHILSVSAIQGIGWTFASASVLITCGRLYIQWKQPSRFSIDDCLSGLAAVLLVLFVASMTLILPTEQHAQLFGLGISSSLPSMESLTFSVKVELATLLLFWLVVYAAKAGLLGLYWRTYRGSPWFRIAWWVTTVFIGISFGMSFMAVFWECGSPSKLGNLEACANPSISLATQLLSMWCALSLIGYLLLMALPLVMIISNLSSWDATHLIGVILMLFLAVVCMVLDVLKTVWYLNETLSSQTNLVAVWTMLEPSIAVIICSLPAYGSIISKGDKTTSVNAPENMAGYDMASLGVEHKYDII